MGFGLARRAAGHRRPLNLGSQDRRHTSLRTPARASADPYHEKHGGDIVWEIGSGYFGARGEDRRFDPARFEHRAASPQVKMVEIKLSQGAKPGHGGMLPGSAKVKPGDRRHPRRVPVGVDCISPAAHSAFSTHHRRDAAIPAAKLRDLAGGKPVGNVKLCVGHRHEVFAIAKAMVETGILLDYIVVDGAEGGTGAAPLELTDHFGAPLKDGLTLVRNALVGTGRRDKIKIGAAGKVYSATGIAAQLRPRKPTEDQRGASSFMFALGCIQSMRCHLDTCPTEHHHPERLSLPARHLVVTDKAARIARFHEKTLRSLQGRSPPPPAWTIRAISKARLSAPASGRTSVSPKPTRPIPNFIRGSC